MAQPEKPPETNACIPAIIKNPICEPNADPVEDEIVALDRFAVSEEKGTCEPENLDEYLADMTHLRDHLRAYKAKLNTSLRETIRESGEIEDESIRQNVQLLCAHIENNFDHIIFSILNFTDAKKNPEIIQRILKNTEAPVIQAASTKKRELGLTVKDFMGMELDRPIIIISGNNELHESYENMKNTFIHEFAHAYLQGNYDNNRRILFEGVTETISRAVAPPRDLECYNLETELATSLINIDKDAVLDWYTGGSNIALLQRIRLSLSIMHPEEKVKILETKLAETLSNFSTIRTPYQEEKAALILPSVNSPEAARTISKLPLENLTDLVHLEDALTDAGAADPKTLSLKFEEIGIKENTAIKAFLEDLIAELKGTPLSSSL